MMVALSPIPDVRSYSINHISNTIQVWQEHEYVSNGDCRGVWIRRKECSSDQYQVQQYQCLNHIDVLLFKRFDYNVYY